MSIHRIPYQEFLAYNSGSIKAYFEIAGSPHNSFQVYKATTGSYSAIRLEVSNFENENQRLPLSGTGQNGYWVEKAISGSQAVLTASSSPASAHYEHVDASTGQLSSQSSDLVARWARVIIDVGAGDLFRISWHGED